MGIPEAGLPFRGHDIEEDPEEHDFPFAGGALPVLIFYMTE